MTDTHTCTCTLYVYTCICTIMTDTHTSTCTLYVYTCTTMTDTHTCTVGKTGVQCCGLITRVFTYIPSFPLTCSHRCMRCLIWTLPAGLPW